MTLPIPTWLGWVYLASEIDCATRKCVGWAMGEDYKTPLITSAIRMAARNVDLPAGAIFHSDRGSNYRRVARGISPRATRRSNYVSAEFAAVLESLGIRQSIGRAG